jgi:hypothetical protein
VDFQVTTINEILATSLLYCNGSIPNLEPLSEFSNLTITLTEIFSLIQVTPITKKDLAYGIASSKNP